MVAESLEVAHGDDDVLFLVLGVQLLLDLVEVLDVGELFDGGEAIGGFLLAGLDDQGVG